MKRTAQSSLATPSPDTVAPKKIMAWASPRPQRAKSADVSAKANGRQRHVAPVTSERDDLAAEREFMAAMQEYREKSGRMFPTWSEVLEVLQGLGYQKRA